MLIHDDNEELEVTHLIKYNNLTYSTCSGSKKKTRETDVAGNFTF